MANSQLKTLPLITSKQASYSLNTEADLKLEFKSACEQNILSLIICGLFTYNRFFHEMLFFLSKLVNASKSAMLLQRQSLGYAL